MTSCQNTILYVAAEDSIVYHQQALGTQSSLISRSRESLVLDIPGLLISYLTTKNLTKMPANPGFLLSEVKEEEIIIKDEVVEEEDDVEEPSEREEEEEFTIKEEEGLEEELTLMDEDELEKEVAIKDEDEFVEELTKTEETTLPVAVLKLYRIEELNRIARTHNRKQSSDESLILNPDF
ncbi:hypothetical protein LSTR_LSTR009171 [Laodelphax striatellus]|uniref:Uncharacterized protein n=1 Tax=Laodelphax striatellus TaxID=195883 RepID=A0A482XE44_LAOST|nr:hypothetical protein LSTR_LSTR009171 [Laodelphax striatellus]